MEAGKKYKSVEDDGYLVEIHREHLGEPKHKFISKDDPTLNPLLPSLIDKINYNFDQILSLGGVEIK